MSHSANSKYIVSLNPSSTSIQESGVITLLTAGFDLNHFQNIELNTNAFHNVLY